MADMNCPYCDAECEVCHDDGAGYSEDELHEHECHDCGKRFVFETSISFHYEPQKADCLNGQDHKWAPTFTTPIEYTRGHCPDCGLERNATEADMTAAIAYRETLMANPPHQGHKE